MFMEFKSDCENSFDISQTECDIKPIFWNLGVENLVSWRRSYRPMERAKENNDEKPYQQLLSA